MQKPHFALDHKSLGDKETKMSTYKEHMGSNTGEGLKKPEKHINNSVSVHFGNDDKQPHRSEFKDSYLPVPANFNSRVDNPMAGRVHVKLGLSRARGDYQTCQQVTHSPKQLLAKDDTSKFKLDQITTHYKLGHIPAYEEWRTNKDI